jgi:hypothetical protein
MSAYAPPGSMAWSAPQYPAAAMSTQSMLSPGLKFFIERDDGSLVPLLPVDELPDDIRLAGVPLGLSPSQVKGMVFLGHDPSVDRKFSHAEFLSINEPGAPVPVVMKYTPEVVPHINHVPQVGTNNFCSFSFPNVIITAHSSAASARTHPCVHTASYATQLNQTETSLQ